MKIQHCDKQAQEYLAAVMSLDNIQQTTNLNFIFRSKYFKP